MLIFLVAAVVLMLFLSMVTRSLNDTTKGVNALARQLDRFAAWLRSKHPAKR